MKLNISKLAYSFLYTVVLGLARCQIFKMTVLHHSRIFRSMDVFSRIFNTHIFCARDVACCYYAGQFPWLFISWRLSFISLPTRRACTVWNYCAFWYYTIQQASIQQLPCVNCISSIDENQCCAHAFKKYLR